MCSDQWDYGQNSGVRLSFRTSAAQAVIAAMQLPAETLLDVLVLARIVKQEYNKPILAKAEQNG